MSNPEQPGSWPDRSWQPMPTPGSAPDSAPGVTPATQPSPTTPMYPQYDPTQPYPGGAYGTPYSAAGYGYGGYGGAPTQTTNGMAIGSMVVSIVSMAGLCAYGFGGLIGIVGAILGHLARRQIRERGEGGDGMALAGIIIGWIATGLGIGIIALFVSLVWVFVNSDTNGLGIYAGTNGLGIADTNGLAPLAP